MEEYRGFQEIDSDDERLSTFYGDLTNNIFDCRQNEHIIVYDVDGVAKDFYRWDGTKYALVGYRAIKNDYTAYQ